MTGADRSKAAPSTAAQEPAAGDYSSPACYAHEIDPAYAGYYRADELVALLDPLVEIERAHARIAAALIEACGAEARPVLAAARHDDARLAAGLAWAIRSLGFTPSRATAAGYAHCLALSSGAARLAVLTDGQACVADRLRQVLPRIESDAIHGRLKRLLDRHEANIARCAALLDGDA